MLIPVLNLVELSKLADSITLRDSTGVYNATTNPGGYGSPNMTSPPAVIGLTARWWNDTLPYANYITTSSVITDLLSTGHKFLATVFQTASKFKDGIHQLKYYPFELVNTGIAWANGSKIITTNAFDPTALDDDYIAAVVCDAAGVPKTSVLLLGNRSDWSSTTLTVDTAWGGTSIVLGAGYKLLVGPEADLKVLVKANTESCVANKVGKLAKMQCCNDEVVDKLTRLTMWMFSADIKTQCGQYQAANDLILNAQRECTYCISDDCTTCK